MNPAPRINGSVKKPELYKEAWIWCLAILLLVAVVGCSTCGKDPAPKQESSTLPLSQPEDRPGLHNVVHVSRTIYSGGEPHGEEAFQELARMGIKTVVSVDGAMPAVDAAERYGLRYVHIPIGYDGVSPEAGLSFAQVAREAKGPVYIHCHHGKHRGPAAAAVVMLACGEGDHADARELLQVAGTSPEYDGLWRDVAAYKPPTEGTALPPLVAQAKVDSMVLAMAMIDRHYDNLKYSQEAGWQTPADHPDIVPAREALLLREQFHEIVRNQADLDPQLIQWLRQSEGLAGSIEEGLKQGRPMDEALTQLKAACKQCHSKYR